MAYTEGLPYSFTNGQLDFSTTNKPYPNYVANDPLIPTELQQQIWGNQLIFAAEEQNLVSLLQGDDGSGAPITHRKINSGKTFTQPFMFPDHTLPEGMDFDLHDYEGKFEFGHQNVTLAAWRKSYITSKLQEQYPNFSLRDATMRGLYDYRLYTGVRHLIAMLLGSDYPSNHVSTTKNLGSLTSTAIIHSGVTCTNQVYAGHVTGVDQLNTDDVFTLELGAIAQAVGDSGMRGANDQTFFFKKPVIGGEQYEGVCLMNRLQAHSARFADPDFKAALLHAEQQGPGNRTWTGLGAKFKYNGVLYIILTGYVGRLLLFYANDTIYNADGVAKVAQCDGATAIYLGAEAAVRATGSFESGFAGEGWDLGWFKRVGTEVMEGYAAVQLKHPDNGSNRDYGRLLIHTAVQHPNTNQAQG